MSVTAPMLKSASSLGEIIRFELLTYSASIYLGFFLIAVYTSTKVFVQIFFKISGQILVFDISSCMYLIESWAVLTETEKALEYVDGFKYRNLGRYCTGAGI